MTLHTIRGATGFIKELYIFHANIVNSCDMSIFLCANANNYGVLTEMVEKKIDACQKMQALFWAELLKQEAPAFLSFWWTYDAWIHYFEFHLGAMAHLQFTPPPFKRKPVNCIHGE